MTIETETEPFNLEQFMADAAESTRYMRQECLRQAVKLVEKNITINATSAVIAENALLMAKAFEAFITGTENTPND